MGKKGQPPERKAPEKKKRLSYQKDCRNDYGENDKASRKAIPLRKARENREDRRRTNQSLTQIAVQDEEKADLIESTARHDINRVGGWTKGTDLPLGKWIERQANWAITRAEYNKMKRAKKGT